MLKKSSGKAKTVAEKTYQYSDYYSNDQLSKGMAETHEQVSDTYMEGTVDRENNYTNSRDDNSDENSIPRKKH
ncbi:YozQ family protein [Oceanobacillus senegalensis]|uniref:YozQ family protein n=1 Tax=Oceanobacillus senegalensis TaxID=1936063 RepID=UPI000A310CFA|nr:YozQ family protein [Oceanobacillus senegalensis]